MTGTTIGVAVFCGMMSVLTGIGGLPEVGCE